MNFDIKSSKYYKSFYKDIVITGKTIEIDSKTKASFSNEVPEFTVELNDLLYQQICGEAFVYGMRVAINGNEPKITTTEDLFNELPTIPGDCLYASSEAMTRFKNKEEFEIEYPSRYFLGIERIGKLKGKGLVVNPMFPAHIACITNGEFINFECEYCHDVNAEHEHGFKLTIHINTDAIKTICFTNDLM